MNHPQHPANPSVEPTTGRMAPASLSHFRPTSRPEMLKRELETRR